MRDRMEDKELLAGKLRQTLNEINKKRSKLRQKKLTQREIATRIGVALEAVKFWLGGLNSPGEAHLAALLEIFLLEGGFEEGREREEAFAVWTVLEKYRPSAFPEVSMRKALSQLREQKSGAQRKSEPPSSMTWGDDPRLLSRERIDWGEGIPSTEDFFGRQKNLARLRQLVLHDGCQLIAVLGIGGIGKTSLVRAFAEENQYNFEYVFWRSLQDSPPLTDFLKDCIQFVSGQNRTDLPESEDRQIPLLIRLLRERRCLLVLDNVDAILQSTHSAGRYREGYEGYGKLFLQAGRHEHQSCLLLTSRENLSEITRLEGRKVCSFPLSGLDIAAVREFLEALGLSKMRDVDVDDLTKRYSGNPLALKLAVGQIREVHHGDLMEFLFEKRMLMKDIKVLLDEQFSPLAPEEKAVMYWLAIERTPVLLSELRENCVDPIQRESVPQAVRSLLSRSLVEDDSSTGRFSLQPVILEYVTDHFVTLVSQELENETFELLESHALMKAQCREHLRDSQVRLLLMPIAHPFVQKGRAAFAEKCKRILTYLREADFEYPGYAAGNVLNLLIQLKYDLREYNFSSLKIREAYLQGALLHDVNFSHATFTTPVFTDTFGGILSVAISPKEGRLVAAGTANNEIRVWHTVSGAPAYTCRGHSNWVRSVAFNSDGSVMASGSEDETIRIWDTASGQCLEILQGHTSVVSAVCFNSDGTLLASGSQDMSIKLWNTQRYQDPPRELKGHDKLIWSIAFSPDGKVLASGGEDRAIRLWDVVSGQPLKVLQAGTKRIHCVVFSPDGKTLASGGDDHKVSLWDIESGRELKALCGHTDWIWSIAFSPDGKTLTSGGEDYTVRFWDIESGKCFRTLLSHSGTVWSVACSPDGKLVASGSTDRTIRLWDSSKGDCLRTLQGYRNTVSSVAFHPQGNTLASGSEDRTVRLWEIDSGRCEALPPLTDRIWSVAFNASGTRLVASALEVGLWDMLSGRWAKAFPHPTWVYSAAFSPDGNFLITGDDDGTVRLWNTNGDDNQDAGILQEGTDACWSVALHPARHVIATTTNDAVIDVWNIDSKDRLWSQAQKKSVLCFAFSPDGTTLVSGGEDNAVRLWLAHNGTCLKTWEGHTGHVCSVAFSPNGRVVASGSQDKTIRLWNTQTNADLLRILEGHEDTVWCVAFHPNGDKLASASEDGTIRLWNIETGTCLQVLRINRPYEGMNITGVAGLTDARILTLKALGAVEDQDRHRRNTANENYGRGDSKKTSREKKLEVFCCYAREDRPLLLKLKKYLAPLEREDLITVWHDAKINAGTEWEEEINRRLDTADIILLLVSPDFIASEYCYSKEMKRAMKLHEEGKARVIPLILRSISWLGTPFGKLQALPADAKPVTEWPNYDKAFTSVIRGLRQVITETMSD